MSNILLFTHKNAPVIVTVTKVEKDCATVRTPIYKLINGKRYRALLTNTTTFPYLWGAILLLMKTVTK